MNILAVLDVMNGVVVRGVAGRRSEYRPISSGLTPSVDPADVAHAMHDHFGLSEFYLADLDAIAGKPPSLSLIERLLGFRLWVDAGVGTDGGHLQSLADAGVHSVIAGLESLAGPELLRQMVVAHGSRLVFSLDMRGGQPLSKVDWGASNSWDIAVQAVEQGVSRMLVLDLAAVGTHQGTPTAGLCGQLRAAFASLEITTGGGVRGMDDLRHLASLGVDHVLIASALHDGVFSADELRAFTACS